MNITAINPYHIQNQVKKLNAKQSAETSDNRTVSQEKLPATNPMYFAGINFKGGKSIAKLWEEYDWYIKNDRTPAIQSFLKIEETPEVLDKFLTEILNTTDRSRELIYSIAYNPRKSNDVMTGLTQKLPANSKNLMSFCWDSPYNQAYTKFIEWKANEAHSLEDLLRMRPDWSGNFLISKFQKLRGTDKVEIGNIPKEIPKNHLDKITDYLSKEMEVGVKNKKKINSLTIDNRTYDFAYFTEGKSDKNVFGIFTPEGKKFVLKMSSPELRSLDAPFALGTLAKIDSYLTYNRSRNSAPLCYYNHDKNYSIYKYIEHTPTQREFRNLTELSETLPDFKALGLTYNDTVGYKNFFLMTPNSNADMIHTEGFQDGVAKGEWVSVDNDHVTYGIRLQPSVGNYHKGLPNAMQMFY